MAQRAARFELARQIGQAKGKHEPSPCHRPPIDDLQAVALSSPVAYRSEGGQELPQRIKVLNWGNNQGRTTGKHVRVTSKTVVALSANQQAAARERISLDYEHQTLQGHPNFKTPPVEVAAFGTVEASGNPVPSDDTAATFP